MTDPRELEPPDRGNEDPQQDDDWEALMELDAQSPYPSPWPSWLYWTPQREAADD